MGDLISRQAAIDALERTKEKDPKGDIACFYNTITDNKIAVIEALPSAYPERCECCETLSKTQLLIPQPEQRWIPCSERLPEIGQSVLFSVGGVYSAEGCLREDGDWAQFRWDAIQRKDMVGAWKPLPEPYRGEGEE